MKNHEAIIIAKVRDDIVENLLLIFEIHVAGVDEGVHLMNFVLHCVAIAILRGLGFVRLECFNDGWILILELYILPEFFDNIFTWNERSTGIFDHRNCAT